MRDEFDPVAYFRSIDGEARDKRERRIEHVLSRRSQGQREYKDRSFELLARLERGEG